MVNRLHAMSSGQIVAALAISFLTFGGVAGENRTTSSRVSMPVHEHHAPHNGTLVELGEEFAHLELVLDDSTGKLSAYALDGEAENSVRLSQPVINLVLGLPGVATSQTLELKPVANPLSGETAGDTSAYDAAATDTLKGVRRFTGSVRSVAIRGSQFNDIAFRFPEGNETH